jgi:hypothetical protein
MSKGDLVFECREGWPFSSFRPAVHPSIAGQSPNMVLEAWRRILRELGQAQMGR